MKMDLKIGAIIVAAGKSSRMGDFKPLLRIHNKSFLTEIIDKLLDVGVSKIVVVTGREAEKVREALQMYDQVHIVHNSEFASTEMFDSIKLGLLNLSEVDRFFLTTADIPLFRESTLIRLLNESGEVIKPSYQNRSGHPILIKQTLVEQILNYQGENGLKGALTELGCSPIYVNVEDQGILFDADTKEDYKRMMEWLDGQKNL